MLTRRHALTLGACALSAPLLPAFARSSLAATADGHVVKRFGSPAELAAYTRYDAISQPLIMAHRAGYFPFGAIPECTIEGAELALRSGPVMIEIDVRTASDGRLVCVHDETLDRGTTGSGPVNAMPSTAIADLHLRDHTGAVTPYRVPMFEDFIRWGANGALLWLDLKDADPDLVVDTLVQHDARSRCIVSAYGMERVQRYAALDPALVYFIPVGTPDDLEAVLDAGMDPGHVIGFAGFDEANEEMVEAYHGHNIPALIDLQSDRELRPGEIDPGFYRAFVDRGILMLNTDHYPIVLQIFGLDDWA